MEDKIKFTVKELIGIDLHNCKTRRDLIGKSENEFFLMSRFDIELLLLKEVNELKEAIRYKDKDLQKQRDKINELMRGKNNEQN